MTKLIIQIPCYNEEATLGLTLSALPRKLPGIDVVEWLVIDDGSADRTVEVARACGVDHVVVCPRNLGLARAFMAGLEASLRAGADIIVNTDADNQYCADDIGKLVEPILAGGAAIVVGARPIEEIAHFSRTKRLLQRLGSWVVRLASNTDIPDAPSGFRAMSREAAIRLNVFDSYTYTLETIIQAGQKGIPITWVPVRVNGATRPSRLFRSLPVYVLRSLFTIVRIFMTYKPLRFFFALGSVPVVLGGLVGVRWLVLFALDALFVVDPPRVRAPSLILTAILILVGVQLWIFGLVADLLGTNRRLLEDIQVRSRRAELAARDAAPR
jgi:glycosyltransferase involved in cell wall biosynthesis